ncbi:MAG: hypothetical protein WEA04_03685 [Candidatus Andersenbacteria bacterium]
MATSSDISVGLAHELVLTACKAGFEPKDFTVLAQSEEKLRQLLCFVRGHAGLTQAKHVIDCDADPLLPYEDWKVEEHKKGGQFSWDPSKLSLYLSDNQRGEKSIEGNKLRRELAERPVLNANVLDYLIRHPHLVPDEWKVDEQGNTLYIYFWGTIYRDADGDLCVRSLCFESGHWFWGDGWLGGGWGSRSPAVLLAS